MKIQIEFNPAQVAEYRLIGYENRVLQREDFANDKVDAGDIGAGHEVTALYEITPAASSAQRVAPLRYGAGMPRRQRVRAANSPTCACATSCPARTRSRLIETPILASQLVRTPSESLRFASAVAGFADALRGGSRMDGWSWDAMIASAAGRRH